MKKFKKGDWIIATRSVTRKIYHGGYGDNPVVVEDFEDKSYTSKPILVLHATPDHLIVKNWGIEAICRCEIEERGFVKATKKMVELLIEDKS